MSETIKNFVIPEENLEFSGISPANQTAFSAHNTITQEDLFDLSVSKSFPSKQKNSVPLPPISLFQHIHEKASKYVEENGKPEDYSSLTGKDLLFATLVAQEYALDLLIKKIDPNPHVWFSCPSCNSSNLFIAASSSTTSESSTFYNKKIFEKLPFRISYPLKQLPNSETLLECKDCKSKNIISKCNAHMWHPSALPLYSSFQSKKKQTKAKASSSSSSSFFSSSSSSSSSSSNSSSSTSSSSSSSSSEET